MSDSMLNDLQKLKILYSVSQTRRWHTKPKLNQNVKEHSYGVALIILTLHPNPSANLLRAALLHDCPEGQGIDIPSPIKLKYPEAAALDIKLEVDFWKRLEMPFPILSAEECLWLKFADYYETVLFARDCYPVAEQVVKSGLAGAKEAAEKLKGLYGYFEDSALILL